MDPQGPSDRSELPGCATSVLEQASREMSIPKIAELEWPDPFLLFVGGCWHSGSLDCGGGNCGRSANYVSADTQRRGRPKTRKRLACRIAPARSRGKQSGHVTAPAVPSPETRDPSSPDAIRSLPDTRHRANRRTPERLLTVGSWYTWSLAPASEAGSDNSGLLQEKTRWSTAGELWPDCDAHAPASGCRGSDNRPHSRHGVEHKAHSSSLHGERQCHIYPTCAEPLFFIFLLHFGSPLDRSCYDEDDAEH